MKRSVLLIFTVLVIAPGLRGQDVEERWTVAQAAYTSGDYQQAADAFEQVLSMSPGSVPAMYNLGNCYVQRGDLGRAILWYERALKLRPGDPDIRQNLDIANARRENALIAVRPFFLTRWIREGAAVFPMSVWAICTILFLWITTGFIAGKLLQRIAPRHNWIGWTAGLVFVLCLFFSAHGYRRAHAGNEAVVLSGTAVTIAPEAGSKLIAQIGPGEKMTILDSLQQYYKVRLVNYEQGWLPVTAVEKI